jgi:hypothetical protein
MASSSDWSGAYGVSDKASIPLREIIIKVQGMASWGSTAQSLASKHGLKVQTVTWEDCARSKGSVWGPCISDMTLQVDGARMPVIRNPNFTDETWDISIDKLPVVVGNHLAGGKLSSISLREYLRDLDKYTTGEVTVKGGNGLLKEGGDEDTHVIVSSQCCFLPVEKTKETKFNVALYSYQSRKDDPAVLTIIATSKGTSAQIIEGTDQLLLFNNGGKKADFSAQRLTDSRIERGVAVEGEMSKEEKQDNVICIIQVPLVQKPKPKPRYEAFGALSMISGPPAPAGGSMSFGAVAMLKSRSTKKEEKPDVEAAIIKVADRTAPACKCGKDLVEKEARFAYGGSVPVNCDGCSKRCAPTDTIYHCPEEKSVYKHRDGYDLCAMCAMMQLQFDEAKGVELKRDARFPIRVTLQYYKSTANGVVDEPIMSAIAAQLASSKKSADFVGSLVTGSGDKSRPTDWTAAAGAKPGDDPAYAIVSAVLRECDLYDTHFAEFKANEINDENVKFFESADDFKDVLPVLGPRMKFFRSLKKAMEGKVVEPPKRVDVDFGGGLFD